MQIINSNTNTNITNKNVSNAKSCERNVICLSAIFVFTYKHSTSIYIYAIVIVVGKMCHKNRYVDMYA